jgi:transposase
LTCAIEIVAPIDRTHYRQAPFSSLTCLSLQRKNHFVSWLKLSPDNKISGGKIIGKGRMPTNNRATTVLRMAATTLRESDSYLGAQFRRFRTRLGPPIATKAMAAKLARLIYRMLRYGMKYVNQGANFYEAQYRKQQLVHLKRKAAQLGLQIIEVAAAA